MSCNDNSNLQAVSIFILFLSSSDIPQQMLSDDAVQDSSTLSRGNWLSTSVAGTKPLWIGR